ncbi:glycosyltransferase family 4 protein [Candidatus Saccharibacteria bacterium]|nr:glycosyltransferase family 4 protein [Candidatus Saccharibacteria bacterium]
MNEKIPHIVIDARIRRSSTGRYIDRLIEHLQKIDSNSKYTILIQKDDNWEPSNSNFTTKVADFKQFSFNPLDQIRFAGMLYDLKADIVHFPMNQQPVLYFGPVVTTTMDLTMLKYTRAGKTPLPIFWLKMIGYRFLFWLSNRKSKAIITISKYVKKSLAEKYKFTTNKTTTTYCAAEEMHDNNQTSPSYIDKDEEFILYVGAAFPHKNLPTLVDALGLIKENSNLKLILVGKKEYYYHKLDKYISKKDYSDRVITTDFIPDSELNWLYQNTSAYVFPSLSEGFGLPGLEAMVHGAPVVSSNSTCLPEIYGDAALYFNPLDAEDMALKIERVLSDKNYRKQLIAHGHKQVKKYSWTKTAEQTLEVYKKVLG